MTLEITRGKSVYQYRINPYNLLVIDRRVNKRGARWQWYRLCSSEQDARNKLLRLERKDNPS